MSSQRLYWDDAYLREWQAAVVARRADDQQVALDRTAFYPEGGGQPADMGTLNGIAVLDVQSEDALIWHTLATPLPAGAVADCILDWERRFDHMQQHHGQHLLSAAFEQVCGARTVAFHLGTQTTTIDLATASLTLEELAQAEEVANAIIWADLPVAATLLDPAEALKLPLRRPPTVAGLVRVVSVPDFDYSACGGTHPRSTGGVGQIVIRRTERRGSETRVEFVCGARALREARLNNGLIQQLAAGFSVGSDQLAAAVTRLREAEALAQRELELATRRLIAVDAAELLAASPDGVVALVWRERPVEWLRALAGAISERGGVALLALDAPKPQLVFASAGTPSCGQLMRTVTAQFGGKGGGPATLAQGGIPDPLQLNAALELARTLL